MDAIIAYSNLTSLDVSGFTSLQKFHCENNNLVSLNVSGCTNLTFFNCENNYLPSSSAILGLGALNLKNFFFTPQKPLP